MFGFTTLFSVLFVRLTPLGEKPFVTDTETADYNRFSSLLLASSRGNKIPDKVRIQKPFKDLNEGFNKSETTKKEIVKIMKEYLPNFEHIETSKSLDSKM